MPEIGDRDLTDAETREITRAVSLLVLAAADRRGEDIADILAEVAGRYGTGGVGLVCCGLAEAITRMTGMDSAKRAGAIAGFGLMRGDGTVINPEDAPAKAQPKIWAYRFVAAYANGGARDALPLFYADVYSDETFAEVAALVNLTGMVARWREGMNAAAAAN